MPMEEHSDFNLSDTILFDTKSEESNSPRKIPKTEEKKEEPRNPLDSVKLSNNSTNLNLEGSKFKPINPRPSNPEKETNVLDIVDNPNGGHPPPPTQPPLMPPQFLMPPFPPGMAPGMPGFPTPLNLMPPLPPGHPGSLPGPGPMPPLPSLPPLQLTSPGSESKEGSPGKPPMPPFIPLPMLPTGPFPPPGLQMPPNLPNLPFPPPFFNPAFPFPPFGRELKKIGKRWGRSKRAKGKVDIDKATGRKLITAITCVACFKAKKKCIYADQNAKRCNYCLNRGINCVKRIDRRCQKVWHESGRRARLYAKAVGGDEEMIDMKEKSEDMSPLKNEESTNQSDMIAEDEVLVGNASDDLLLSLPDPEPLLRGRQFFQNSRNPLWNLIAENANNPNVG